jgi:Flp pilus assembly protein TadD
VRAVELARREVENRPDVFTEDVLAWALHRAGHDAEAADAITRALRTGIHDARVLFHAGMIREARGDHDGAAAALTAALSQNPYWSMAEAEEARRALRAMGAAIPAEPLAQPDPPAHAPGPPAT